MLFNSSSHSHLIKLKRRRFIKATYIVQVMAKYLCTINCTYLEAILKIGSLKRITRRLVMMYRLRRPSSSFQYFLSSISSLINYLRTLALL